MGLDVNMHVQYLYEPHYTAFLSFISIIDPFLFHIGHLSHMSHLLKLKNDLLLLLFFQFPYCDGAHAKHNQETGDNVGPLIIKRKEA